MRHTLSPHGLGKDLNGGEAADARGAGRLQALRLLLQRGVEQDLIRYRESGGVKVQDWVRGLQHCVVDFPDNPEAFCNINTPDTLYAADFI